MSSHHVSGSTIRVADPNGRWSFEARAERIEAESLDGPYLLQVARCRYQQPGRPPILMEAAQARIEKAAAAVVLQGDVHITSQTWALESERVAYDLNRGKVVASRARNPSPANTPAPPRANHKEAEP